MKKFTIGLLSSLLAASSVSAAEFPASLQEIRPDSYTETFCQKLNENFSVMQKIPVDENAMLLANEACTEFENDDYHGMIRRLSQALRIAPKFGAAELIIFSDNFKNGRESQADSFAKSSQRFNGTNLDAAELWKADGYFMNGYYEIGASVVQKFRQNNFPEYSVYSELILAVLSEKESAERLLEEYIALKGLDINDYAEEQKLFASYITLLDTHLEPLDYYTLVFKEPKQEQKTIKPTRPKTQREIELDKALDAFTSFDFE